MRIAANSGWLITSRILRAGTIIDMADTENMMFGMSNIVSARKIQEVNNRPELAAMRMKNDEKMSQKSRAAGI